MASRTYRSQEYWINQYREKDAWWLHDGNPKRPHALLTSGKHSTGFCNSEPVLEDSVLLDDLAIGLVSALERSGLSMDSVDRVIGPAMGAITIADAVARHIGMNRERVPGQKSNFCLRAYAEKDTTIIVNRKGHQIEIDASALQADDLFIKPKAKKMTIKRSSIRQGERGLIVEDVLTTGDSIRHTAQAFVAAGGILLPRVAVLVNRSLFKTVDDIQVVSLIEQDMPIFDPADCQLCKLGSEAIRPKNPIGNWYRLNSTY